MLVAASSRSNANLDPQLTAYTPGETLKLLANGKVAQWHERMAHFRVPKGFDTVVFEDACRGIDIDGSMAAARAQFKNLGVRCMSAAGVAVAVHAAT